MKTRLRLLAWGIVSVTAMLGLSRLQAATDVLADKGAEKPAVGVADCHLPIENDLYQAHDGSPNT